MLASAKAGPVQIGGKKEIDGGVAVTTFKSFTGGRILEFRLNSGAENPFFSNFFSIHVVNGKGTPSALNGRKVNPLLLEIVAMHLKTMNVEVAQNGKAEPNFFLEQVKAGPGTDWKSLKLAPESGPKDTGIGTPWDNEHG